MQQFKIHPDGITEIKKKMLWRSIPIVVIATAAGIAISFINNDQETGLNTLVMTIPLAAIAVGFGIYTGVKRQLALLESYRIFIINDVITREQKNTQPIVIHPTELREIIKNKDGGFIVKGKADTDTIIIPAQVERHSELEAHLNSIKPIQAKLSSPLLEKYRSLLPLITVGLMVTLFTSTNKMIVAVTGILLVVLMSLSALEIRKSKNIDRKTKRNAWWVIFVLLSVIGVMVVKLTAA